MLKVKDGIVEADGSQDELLIDLACIIKGLHEAGNIKKEYIKYAVRLGFMTGIEVKKETKNIEEIIEKLFGGKKDD